MGNSKSHHTGLSTFINSEYIFQLCKQHKSTPLSGLIAQNSKRHLPTTLRNESSIKVFNQINSIH